MNKYMPEGGDPSVGAVQSEESEAVRQARLRAQFEKRYKTAEAVVLGHQFPRDAFADGLELERYIAGLFFPRDKNEYKSELAEIMRKHRLTNDPRNFRAVALDPLYDFVRSQYGGDPEAPRSRIADSLRRYVLARARALDPDIRIGFIPTGSKLTPLDHVGVDCFFYAHTSGRSEYVNVGVDVWMKGRGKDADDNYSEVDINEMPPLTDQRIRAFVMFYGERVFRVLREKWLQLEN